VVEGGLSSVVLGWLRSVRVRLRERLGRRCLIHGICGCAGPAPAIAAGGWRGALVFPILYFRSGRRWVCLVLILLAAVILGIVLRGSYLVYAAPQIFPEAAWQFALSGALKSFDRRWRLDAGECCVVGESIYYLVRILADVAGFASITRLPYVAANYFTCFSLPRP